MSLGQSECGGAHEAAEQARVKLFQILHGSEQYQSRERIRLVSKPPRSSMTSSRTCRSLILWPVARYARVAASKEDRPGRHWSVAVGIISRMDSSSVARARWNRDFLGWPVSGGEGKKSETARNCSMRWSAHIYGVSLLAETSRIIGD